MPDVEQFPGHIACDGDSKSEIVVPIVHGGMVCRESSTAEQSWLAINDTQVVAIIDIDCAVVDGFDAEDQHHLEALAKLLTEACDW